MTVKTDGDFVLGRGQWVHRPWGRRTGWAAAGGWGERQVRKTKGTGVKRGCGVGGGDLGGET